METRQPIQLELNLESGVPSEARIVSIQGVAAVSAEKEIESQVKSVGLMVKILEEQTMRRAWKKIKANKGSAGIDGIRIEEFENYFETLWPELKGKLERGEYQPQPVRRMEIGKPDGGKRQLGIPTVLDRVIQQAMLEVLQPIWEQRFHKHSYGFRPGKSAHQAVNQAQAYIREGYRWVVDIDLEKFFDRVNHDRLMSRLSEVIGDKALLKLVRAYLNAGVMIEGVKRFSTEGTPQGGPLSPLLANVVLNELDWELENRGLKFVRFADDCNIYVRSRKAAERVMKSVGRFIEGKLKLRINAQKSAAARPWDRKILGFSFTRAKESKKRIATKSLEKFKDRIRELTKTGHRNWKRMLDELNVYLRGWGNYFGHCQTPRIVRELDGWVRHRMRALIWRNWKTNSCRYRELMKRGIKPWRAWWMSRTTEGAWKMSNIQPMHCIFSEKWFAKQGLVQLTSLQTS
jgi:RNA-directed DNA polymerase